MDLIELLSLFISIYIGVTLKLLLVVMLEFSLNYRKWPTYLYSNR